MNAVLKITADSNSIVIGFFHMLALLSWGVLLKWIIFGQFFEKPVIPVIIVGCISFLLVDYFRLESKAFVVFDSSRDGEAKSLVRYGRKMREYKYQGLKNIEAICVIRDSDGGEDNQYLLFKNGYELHIPSGERVVDLTKTWFKEQYDIDLKVTYVKLWDGFWKELFKR